MNVNLPLIKLYVRDRFLFDQDSSQRGLTRGVLMGARSIQGQAYQFHVLLENGALFCGLPIHALAHKLNAPDKSLSELQMWDCLAYEIECIEFKLLRNMPCLVTYADLGLGKYLFSLDSSNQYSNLSTLPETPDEWKLNHFIELNDGNYCVVPSYKINFLDKSLCDFSKPIPKYQVNTRKWMAE